MSTASLFQGYLEQVHQLIEDELVSTAEQPLGLDESAGSEQPVGLDETVGSEQPTRLDQANHNRDLNSDLNRYLYQPLQAFTASGGKRTRPALCLLGAEACFGSQESALALACALEAFQSAALIHDDIADKSELRRGKPCLYLQEGVGIATNVGDLALVQVVDLILKYGPQDPELQLRILCELTAMEKHTLEGQALDLGWARDERWDVSVEDYLYMAAHKTAYYSAAVPLAAGALCAGADDEHVEALRQFGMATGLVFQLQDDILNICGDSAQQGKDFRSDISEGKRTLLAVWALNHLPSSEKAELRAILSSSTNDAALLERAVNLMEQSGALEYTRSYARTLTQQAKEQLTRVELEPHARDILLSMADYFVERTH